MNDDSERRGFSWVAMLVILLLTLAAALVLAYMITKHNFPAH